MGWTFRCDTSFDKERLVYYLLSAERSGPNYKVLAHRVVGNHLWTAMERTSDDGATERFIGLDLMRSGHPTEGWGYKDLCESMGPCEVDCPLAFLDMVPPPDSKYAEGWREKVRAHHAATARRRKLRTQVKPGDVVEVAGHEYVLVAPRVRHGRKAGWFVDRCSDGHRFRMSSAMLGQALVQGGA